MSVKDESLPMTVDLDNPWPGLFSYTEDTRSYFHGRDEETAELARRVQRKLLTVLFGQSGLGKTSLLRAGLVPKLRAEGYCPIYVRVDYAPESPEPAEQIKQAILKESTAVGSWSCAGSAHAGESLWEFMHHRGDLLRDADGKTLLPLLIFDQFEEIFTLAQADGTGRSRAKHFLAELADLIENRPPSSLEARLEQDENAAEAFDFARADYRVLIALREDYLAHLESVKGIMPSITQNRMRLARMSGKQALNAICKPGGDLVSQEVAESIVRFVAGGSELAHAEIEPSLLNLVCRELNTTRLRLGRNEISADLLAGTRETILSEFYERTLADQPLGVRRVIEDELLTDSGYRESLAEERVLKALAGVGAAPDVLAALVDRRLLRIEERLDMRRVEITHDVLCNVVLASRTVRHEREARDEAQRMLAAQHLREAASHRALLRARAIASVCAVLMLIAGASAIFGWINLQRARASDAAAQKSRSDAEKLVGFLIEDFYAELEPTGRLDTLGRLAHMTVNYYDGLPQDLMTPRTQTYRAMALIREGAAMLARGDAKNAYQNYHEAQDVFEKLYQQGDRSEAVIYGLALVLYNQGYNVLGGGMGKPEQLEQAATLLRPLVYGPNPSRQSRLLYANTLNVFSHTQAKEVAVATCEEARKILIGLGALTLTDLNAASAYADTTDSQARHELTLGRLDDAQRHEQEVYAMAEQVLAQRPDDIRSLQNRYYAADLLGTLADRRHDVVMAAKFAERAVQAGEDYVRFDPSDLNSWSLWIREQRTVSDLQFERGEVSRATATARAIVALAEDKRRPASLGPLLNFTWIRLAVLERQLGRTAASEQAAREGLQALSELVAQFAPGDTRRKIFSVAEAVLQSRTQLIDGHAQAALNMANSVIARLEPIKPMATDLNGLNVRSNYLRIAYGNGAAAALRLGNFAQAEVLARKRLSVPQDRNSEANPGEESSAARSLLAHAMALQGRGAEAQKILAPALAYYQYELQSGARGTSFRQDFAYALYASALTRAGDASGRLQREADLNAASKQLAAMSPEAQKLLPAAYLAKQLAAAR